MRRRAPGQEGTVTKAQARRLAIEERDRLRIMVQIAPDAQEADEWQAKADRIDDALREDDRPEHPRKDG
jgi:hypothetical protein